MKKLLVLAMMATLLMAGSAFAIGRTTPAPNATFQFGTPGIAVGPTTTNNDDSCDIGVAPAATLLLPYFEVDTANRTQTTLFTITNVTRYSQIAHVTVWTDYSFPVLDFNIFLTAYDVQPINLMDVLTTGTVAQAAGTGPTTAQSPIGTSFGTGISLNASPNFSNPNFSSTINCSSLPGVLPANLVAAVRSALTTGVYAPGGGVSSCTGVGGTHANAIGYVTIDVAANCSTRLPSDSAYFTTDILFDNVFIGDYEQLGPAANGTTASTFDGAGNAMVHIRAVPEGGGAGSVPTGTTNLPYTFYDRYTPTTNRLLDRRQPLPSTWAARYIQGGAGAFATNYKIWREGFGSGTCSTVGQNATLNVTEIVRFDEHENSFVNGTTLNCSPCLTSPVTLPETSATNTANNSIYPNLTGPDVGGWMYLNLNNGGSTGYSVTTKPGNVILTGAGSTSNLAPVGSATVGPRPSQNWVIVEMFGNVGASRLSVDFDAAWLGNGCSPAALTATVPNGGVGVFIGPAGGVFVCPPGTTLTNGTPCGTPPATGTNTTPLP
jgi:hypothetical protein